MPKAPSPSTCTEVDGRFRKQELNIASKTVFIAISQRAEEVRKLPTQRNTAVQSINWRFSASTFPSSCSRFAAEPAHSSVSVHRPDMLPWTVYAPEELP